MLRIINNEELRAKVPAVFAERPSNKVSNKYEFVNTLSILEHFKAQGWHIVKAQQTGHGLTGHHVIRLQQGQQGFYGRLLTVGERVAQIVFSNSHDRSKKLEAALGMYECVCANQLVVSRSTLAGIEFKHLTCNAESIRQAIEYFNTGFSQVAELIEKMKGIQLEPQDQLNMGIRAIRVRWTEINRAPKTVDAYTVNKHHRIQDNNASLWSTFNRIQENVLTHRLNNVKAIRSCKEDLRINQALWDLAVSYIPKAV